MVVMDEEIRHIASRAISNIEKSIKIGNHPEAANFIRDIISISLAKNSKAGILVGEILESSVVQYGFLLRDYHLSHENIQKEDDLLLDLVGSVRSAMGADAENKVYDALSALRMHVTREQLEGFPTKYRIRSKITRRF